LIDGNRRAEINPEQSAVAQFNVDEEAELIEVYGDDQHGALLLGTHLLSFNGPDTKSHTITLEGGQRLSFTINLLRDEQGSTNGARVEVAFKETGPARATALVARRLWTLVIGAERPTASPAGWWKPVAAFSVLVVLFAGAWWVWTNRQNGNEFVRVTPTPAPNLVPALIPTPLPTPVPPTFGPDKPPNREQESAQPPVNHAPQNQNGISTPPVLTQRERTTPERNETIVERVLLPDTTANAEPGEVATRGVWNRDVMGKPLGEVRRVHIQIAGETASGDELLNQLRAHLTGDSRLQLSDAEQADAALKISLRPASFRAVDRRVIVIVRAANANGYVVWPATQRGSSWRYVGQPRYVAERLVADLTRDIDLAKRR
jgi:hypothetical protein